MKKCIAKRAMTPRRMIIAVESAPCREVIMKCDRCGLQSDVEQAFSSQKRLGGPPRRFCPDCTLKHQTRSFLFDIALIIGAGILIFAVNPGSRAAGTVLLISLIVLFMLPLILMHELAHAAVAKLTGLRVFGIVIGVGKTIWSGKMFDMQWMVNSLPIGGITSVGARPVPNIRGKLFLVYLAGPASHVLLAYAAHSLSRMLPAGSFGGRFLVALVFANILLALVNLFPRKLSLTTGVQGTDGWHLIRAPFLKEQELAKLHVGYFAAEALLAYTDNDFDTAQSWVEQALTLDGNSAIARNVLGILQMAHGEYPASRETFLQLLETEEAKQPALHYILLNNVAYLNALMGDPALLTEADHYSAEALKHLPWVPPVIGTRGTVLVELGQIEEGVAMLKKSMSLHLDKQGKALNACHIALGEFRRGETAEAHKYLVTAQTLDPNCVLLPRVKTELSGAPGLTPAEGQIKLRSSPA
jgi:tetratricopeptide (TPR) repeat protein